MYPHEMPEVAEFGRSPGNGITPALISRDPLATEGEATFGPDDFNPYDEREAIAASASTTQRQSNRIEKPNFPGGWGGATSSNSEFKFPLDGPLF